MKYFKSLNGFFKSNEVAESNEDFELDEDFESDEDRKSNKTFKSKIKLYAMVAIAALVLIIAIFIFIFKGTGETTISIETSLKEVLETAEVSTVEYTYNSIAEKKEDDKIKYYVKYKGIVKAGFDFEKLDVSKDAQNKNKMIISIPEITINSVSVDENMEYIFEKNKYETEQIYDEAYRLCHDDLKAKAEKNITLKNMAKEGAEKLIRGLAAPFEEEGYLIEIVHATNEQEVQ